MTATKFDLRRERVNKGFSIRGLAQKLGLAPNTVARIEDGEVPLPATAKRIADFFDVTVADIAPGLLEDRVG